MLIYLFSDRSIGLLMTSTRIPAIPLTGALQVAGIASMRERFEVAQWSIGTRKLLKIVIGRRNVLSTCFVRTDPGGIKGMNP